jgi:peptidyl-prolyl cis-trans isomerase SurA
MKALYGIIIFAITLLFPAVGQGEVIDRIVAIVNDDIITLADLQKYVKVEKKDRFVSVNEYFRNMQLRDKMDAFIDDVLVKQQAKKLKLEIYEKELQGIVDNIKKQYLVSEDELKEQLKKEGVSYKDFYEGLRTSALRSRVLARAISAEFHVTDKDLRTYYEKNVGQFREEEYRLMHIFISNKREDAQMRAMTAHNLLKEGVTFEETAKRFSDDPSSAQGGDIGFVKREDLIPQLYQAVGLLSPGAYSEILATPYGLHILRLMEVKRGETIPFDAVKEKIHARIVQEESAKRYKEYIGKLRKASYIEVKI